MVRRATFKNGPFGLKVHDEQGQLFDLARKRAAGHRTFRLQEIDTKELVESQTDQEAENDDGVENVIH